MLLICQNRENHSPEVLICLHWQWSSLYWQTGFYGKKNKNIHIYWENLGGFLQKSKTFSLALQPNISSQSSLLSFILFPLGLSSETFFSEIFIAVKTISMLWHHLLFYRLTTSIHLHLNWTQHSHWVFTGAEGGQMIILCHFQAPFPFTIFDKKFAGLRKVCHIQVVILYNIYILFLLIITRFCTSKIDLCSSFSLEVLMKIFIKSQIIIIRHIWGFLKKTSYPFLALCKSLFEINSIIIPTFPFLKNGDRHLK